MKNFILVFLGVILIILENSILNYIDIFGISINMLLIYMSIIPLFLKRNEGAFIGLVLGILKDVLIGRFLGLNAVIFFLIGYAYGILKDKIFKDSIVTIVILVCLSTFFESTIKFIFMNSFFNNESIMFFIYKGLILIPILNIIGTLLVYGFLYDFIKKIEHI